MNTVFRDCELDIRSTCSACSVVHKNQQNGAMVGALVAGKRTVNLEGFTA